MKMEGQGRQHRDHPIEESCSGGSDKKMSEWMCWTCSWRACNPSGVFGTIGRALLCMGHVVT